MSDFPTLEFLKKKYGNICIPLDIVRRHYASHLGMPQLLRKIREGKITLRVVKGTGVAVRSEWSTFTI